MIEGITLIFNDVDISNKLSTYNVIHRVEKPVELTMMDGTEYYFQRRRPEITFSYLPLTDAEIRRLHNALSDLTGEVHYTDPNFSMEGFGQFRVISDIERIFALNSVDGNRYYKGGVITLRQRTAF